MSNPDKIARSKGRPGVVLYQVQPGGARGGREGKVNKKRNR